MEYEEANGIGSLIVEFFTNHGWLELIYLYLIVYISMHVRKLNALFTDMLGDSIHKKPSRWNENILEKLISPLTPIMLFALYSMASILYSGFFSIPFYFLSEMIGFSFSFTSILLGAGLGLFTYLVGQIQLASGKSPS
jgi:hypothetical protein